MARQRKRLEEKRGAYDLPLTGEYWLIENDEGEDRAVRIWLPRQ